MGILLPIPERISLLMAQRLARHVSPSTTAIYTHAAEEQLWEGIR